MTENEFQELLNKLELIWDERVDEIIELIHLRKFHKWLDEQEEIADGHTG